MSTAVQTAPPRRREPLPQRTAALSPSRAADFMACPLLYRFRVIDRLPSPPSPAAARGTLVHAVLERLFDLPADDRTPERAVELLAPEWERLVEEEPELATLLSDDGLDAPDRTSWFADAAKLVDTWFTLEDPTRLEPAERELYVEADVGGLTLRGYVDRLDVAPNGAMRVVDYKTGRVAVGVLRGQGAVPDAVLRAGAVADARRRADDAPAGLPRQPRAAALLPRRGRPARHRAQGQGAVDGDRAGRRPPATGARSPSKLCDWCDHRAICPAWGGTPPPLPERASLLAVDPEETGRVDPADE